MNLDCVHPEILQPGAGAGVHAGIDRVHELWCLCSGSQCSCDRVGRQIGGRFELITLLILHLTSADQMLP